MFGEAFTVICALLGIIGLIFLAFWATGWLRKRFGTGSFGSAGRIIKVRECMGIAQDKQLMIVTVGSKTMLIGVTQSAVTKICDLDEEDLLLPDTEAVPPENGFMQSLKKAFAERKGGSSGAAGADFGEMFGSTGAKSLSSTVEAFGGSTEETESEKDGRQSENEENNF